MDLLESFESGDIKGRPIWCYYSATPYDEQRRRPSERIQELMAQHKGVIVAVPDFDLLMILLGQRIGVQLLDQEIEERADLRQKLYRDRVDKIDTAEHPIVAEALYDICDRSGGLWAWERKAESMVDLDKRRTIYTQALKQCPNSHELLGNFANFLTDQRSEHNEAEKHYLRAIEACPEGAIVLNNYAAFSTEQRSDYDTAEKHHLLAIKMDPENADIIGSYALFLNNVRGDYDEATRYYLRAIKANPEDAIAIGNYAEILVSQLRFDESDAQIQRLWKLLNSPLCGSATVAAWIGSVTNALKQEPDGIWIERLRENIATAVHDKDWRCDDCTAKTLRDNLEPHDSKFFLRIAEWIGDPNATIDFDALMRERTTGGKSPRKPSKRKTTKKVVGKETAKPKRTAKKKSKAAGKKRGQPKKKAE